MNKLHFRLKFQKKNVLSNRVSIVCGLHFMLRFFLLTHSLVLPSVIHTEIEINIIQNYNNFQSMSVRKRLISYRTYYSKLAFHFNELNYLRFSMPNPNLKILSIFIISVEFFFVYLFLFKEKYN